jgi:hypothetical protein
MINNMTQGCFACHETIRNKLKTRMTQGRFGTCEKGLFFCLVHKIRENYFQNTK